MAAPISRDGAPLSPDHARVAVIGECMLEVSLAENLHNLAAAKVPGFLSFGGDVLNTAVYLSRLGCCTEFATALGDDALSDWLLARWREEGVGCSLVQRIAGASPGLYLIATDAAGERSFNYWRAQSAAAKLFGGEGLAASLWVKLEDFPRLYLTGITLALCSEANADRLLEFIDRFRARGGVLIFDSNYRPRLWPDRALARDLFARIYRRCDMALLTLEDERALFGDGDAPAVEARLCAAGIDELVLKRGARGCTLIAAGQRVDVPAQSVSAVDTTSAGDAFNAGYLASRIAGAAPREAALFAHRLAALVVQHPGAIVPRPDWEITIPAG